MPPSVTEYDLVENGVTVRCRPLRVRERLSLKARAIGDFGAAVHDAFRLAVTALDSHPAIAPGPAGLADDAVETIAASHGLGFVGEVGARVLERAALLESDRKN